MKILLPALLSFALSTAWAQSLPSFEVASIHPSEPGQPSGEFHTSPGEFRVHNLTLRTCMEWAWEIKPIQLSGPAWLGDERFDISARAADRSADDDKLRLMFRTLLSDRFGLKVNNESKEQPIYTLTLAKNGPKFHSAGPKDGSKFLESAGGATSFSEDKTGAIAQNVTIDDIAGKISQLLDRMIVNKTGLTARYDLRIDLTPFMTTEPDGARSDMQSVLFEGFNQQLGLKLEPGKEVIDFVVIDSISKTPVAN